MNSSERIVPHDEGAKRLSEIDANLRREQLPHENLADLIPQFTPLPAEPINAMDAYHRLQQEKEAREDERRDKQSAA